MYLHLLLNIINLIGGAGFFFLFLLIISVMFVLRSGCMVSQSEVVIIERLGKFHSILYPGFHFIIPFLDQPRHFVWSHLRQDPNSKRAYRDIITGYRIDLRENVYEFPRQNVITKDNVTMEISAILYQQITDPRRALYEIQNLPESIEKLAQTKLREVIGSLDLDESLVSRDYINEKLREALDGATDKWGVKVNRVELQEIMPPSDIKIAMEKQMRAERDRRASILEAEGEKQSAVLRAEGAMLAEIKRATGVAESRRIIAEGEAQAKKVLAEAEAAFVEIIAKSRPGEDPAKYILSLNYIKALSEMTSGERSKTVVLPYEISSVLGSVSTMKELFGK